MLVSGIVSTTLAITLNPLASEPEPLVEAPQSPKIELQATTGEEPIKDTLTCVTWLRQRVPELPRGDAKDFITNSLFPRLNGVVKLKYEKQYHLGQVVEVVQNGIWVDHYMNNREMHSFITFDSGLIEGYWSPVE